MRRLLIVGAGGHGRSLADIVLMTGEYELAGFADDEAAQPVDGWVPVLGTTADLPTLRAHAECVVVGIGNNRARRALCEEALAAGYELVNIVHPKAVISPRARLGRGIAVMAGGIIGTEAQLGDGVIVNSGAVVDHHCRVDDYGHLGVSACMAGGSMLGAGAWMQAGSALGYAVQVPAGVVIGPGVGVSAEDRLE